MSKERLRAECLPPDAECVYVKVTVNGILAGHVLACRWSCGDKTICWITQLVVHRNYRERGLARGLLHELKQDSDDFYGIASSHPAACLAATRAFGRECATETYYCKARTNCSRNHWQCSLESNR